MKLKKIAALVAITFPILSHANQSPLTFEQYKKNIEFRMSGLYDYLSQMDQFEKEKRKLTLNELYAKACSMHDQYRETTSYINHYPEYKNQILNHKFMNQMDVYQIESGYSMYKDFLAKNDVKCPETVEMPPFTNQGRWREIPKVKGQTDLTIRYIDNENLGFSSIDSKARSAHIRELFKTHPDEAYVEYDYLVYCPTKEYSLSRMKIFRDVEGQSKVNTEFNYPAPLRKDSVAGLLVPIYEYVCR